MSATDFREPLAHVVWFYNQCAGAENMIQEANNDAGLAGAAGPLHLRFFKERCL